MDSLRFKSLKDAINIYIDCQPNLITLLEESVLELTSEAAEKKNTMGVRGIGELVTVTVRQKSNF